MYFWYNLLWLFLTPLFILFFLVKRRSNEKFFFRWRFGFYNPDFLTCKDFKARIWIHAASVGEINAIASFIQLLRQSYPQAWIGISTMTATGLAMAEAKIPEANRHFIVPLDFFGIARRSMCQIRPTLFLTVETEIWPNLLKYAKRYGASVMMINGRISVRTINMYLRFKRFVRKSLGFYDACSMILPVDAERITAMGIDPGKIHVNGNVKFDSLTYRISTDTWKETAKSLNLTGKELILVAGSTREGEEEQILKAFQKITMKVPGLILIMAPRHTQRANQIKGLIKQYGYQPLLRTEISPVTPITPGHVIILNTMGELFMVYSLATIAFCGGSLVDLGGQNPLEPAAWGKVVLYGPSMDDFLDAKQFLEEAGVGIEVRNAEELAEQVISLLSDRQKLLERGSAGQKAIVRQQGSSMRNLELVKKFIKF